MSEPPANVVPIRAADAKPVPQCPHCLAMSRRIASLESERGAWAESEGKYMAMVADYDRDGRRLRRRVAELERELSGHRQDQPEAPEAEQVFAFWRELIAPNARKFTDDRRTAVQARLKEGWTVAELLDAVRGAHVDPWERNGVTYDDLRTICKSDESVRMHLKKWHVVHARELERWQAAYAAEQDQWLPDDPALTLDVVTGAAVPISPPPLHDLDDRSTAQRVFDQTILRHCLIARRRHGDGPLPPPLDEAESTAQGRLTALLERLDRIGADLKFNGGRLFDPGIA